MPLLPWFTHGGLYLFSLSLVVIDPPEKTSERCLSCELLRFTSYRLGLTLFQYFRFTLVVKSC